MSTTTKSVFFFKHLWTKGFEPATHAQGDNAAFKIRNDQPKVPQQQSKLENKRLCKHLDFYIFLNLINYFWSYKKTLLIKNILI